MQLSTAQSTFRKTFRPGLKVDRLTVPTKLPFPGAAAHFEPISVVNPDQIKKS